jgi:hypothetical protein
MQKVTRTDQKLVHMAQKLGLSNRYSRKLMSTLFSVKFQILVVASAFLYFEKLDQANWVTVVLTVAGFRTINEVSGVYKSVKAAQTGAKKNATK